MPFPHLAGPWLVRLSMAIALAAAPVQAQYINTHSGHPGRLDDATPVTRRSVDVDLFGVRVERLVGGITRTRIDPGFTWGALPQSEFGLRVPVIWLNRPGAGRAARTAGVAGVAVNGMHAFNLETPGRPAMALSTEVLLPAGELAAPRTAFVTKLIATKHIAALRLHVNVGGGVYSVRVASPFADSTCTGADSVTAGVGGCAGPPIIIDLPCEMAPLTVSPTASPTAASIRARAMCAPPDASSSRSSVATREIGRAPRPFGARWLAAAGLDRAVALSSLLIGANVVVERFVGLYDRTDMYAESGVRWQATPRAVVDAGVSWHFAGTIRSVAISAGASFDIAMPLVVRRPSP